MIINYNNYIYYFIQVVLMDIICIIDIKELPCHTPCCNGPSTALAFITYRGISLIQPRRTMGARQVLRRPRAPQEESVREKIAQAVLNGSGVIDRNYWQFSQGTFNGDDVENWILVVELV